MQRSGSPSFYAGLFVIAGSILSLQILHTRILSLMLWYSLAFFSISMAMLGMTAGALLVYFRGEYFATPRLRERLAEFSLYFAISTVVSWFLLLTTLAFVEVEAPFMTALLFAKLTLVLAPPHVCAGVVISLALTRSPYPVGIVYAADLLGAAAGCFLVLLLMNLMDGVSAILAVAALGGLAALLFGAGATSPTRERRRKTAWFAVLTVFIAVIAVANALVYPKAARIVQSKGSLAPLSSIEASYWNSFSNVRILKPVVEPPSYWGASPKTPFDKIEPIAQRSMQIDGAAGTTMYLFQGSREELSFLEYDITNLAYRMRSRGAAAVIGVGGGRDILSAYYFGFDRITGVDINPIFVENLTGRYRDFSRIADLPGVDFVVDEARSWFTRTDRRFDLIQMSLIDTWAATGAGAFSLTENGLYTVDAWVRFLGRLQPDGVFTVSRWYSSGNPGETGRMVSLAKATLFRLGAAEPNRHMFLAATEHLATLIVSPSPLSEVDVAHLRRTSAELAFNVLMDPASSADDPILRAIYQARDERQLTAAAAVADSPLDFSPPTDDRPFFFNQLRFGGILKHMREPPQAGVLAGNTFATIVLLIVILVSLVAVLITIILPAFPTLRRTAPRLTLLGSAYFLSIGLGFMFVEIGFMQRLSIFLGHPVHGLAIGLAGIILATGLGSAISEVAPLDSPFRLVAWSGLTGAYLLSVPFWFPPLVAAFAGSDIGTRGAVAILSILPAGVLLGFGFPTGMRLVRAIDAQPTPWFWAVNGAAGVLASGLAVAMGTFVSINAVFAAAALCYVLTLPMALGLLRTRVLVARGRP